MKKILKCNACEYEGEMKILFTNISDIGDREVILCPNCGLEFLYPRLTEEDKSKIYDVDDYTGWGNENEAFISMKKEKFRKVIKSVLKYKNSGKLLDVGCGLGYLLEVANEMGFESYGVELSKNGSNIAKKKFGEDKIYNGTVETCNWKNMFDIITMNDLFEHIDNPVETLIKSKELLNNTMGGGYIVITTPNTDSITRKILKSKWTHYQLQHLSYFNKKSIYESAKRSGFEVIEFKPFWKVLTLSYLSHVFKKYPLKGANEIFGILEKIPFINNIKIPLLIGESLIILKAKN